jgi:hypothetical protein
MVAASVTSCCITCQAKAQPVKATQKCGSDGCCASQNVQELIEDQDSATNGRVSEVALPPTDYDLNEYFGKYVQAPFSLEVNRLNLASYKIYALKAQ